MRFAQNFTVEIKVKDVAGGPTAPTFTKVFTPSLDSTVLKDEATIHVGAKQLHPQSLQVEWGQVSQPILNYLQPSPLPPPAGIFFEYGETTGSLVQFFGMNGSNSNGNTGIGPIATLPNQNGLTWTITAQQQPFSAPPLGESPQTNIDPIFEINATTGVLTEITPGTGLGLYYLTIGLVSGDSTALANFNLKLTIGRPTATGSFEYNLRGENATQLEYDSSYIFNLHNTLGTFGQESWAYARIPSYTGINSDVFHESYPDPGGLSSVNGLAAGPVALSGQDWSNAGNSYTARYQYQAAVGGNAGSQFLRLRQAVGGGNDGALTQGTGYINIEMIIAGIFNDATGATGSTFQKSEISWAVEYREIDAQGNVGQWKPANDIEGNVLSWNGALNDDDNDPQPNPQQSGLSLEGERANNPFSSSIHSAENSFGGSVRPQRLIYGVAEDVGTVDADDTSIPINFIRYEAEQQAPNLGTFVPQSAVSRWIAVGNSPIYNTSPCFGEYRVIIQNIGGQSEYCQSELVEFTLAPNGGILQPENPNSLSGDEAGIINFGDFYYDLRPADGPRAFGYIVHTAVFNTKALALNTNINTPAEDSNTKLLYAEEGVLRYVSQFYEDFDMTIPYTGWTGNGGNNGWIAYEGVEESDIDYNMPYSINNTVNGQDADSGTTDPGLTSNMAAENSDYEFGNTRRWACQVDVTTGIKIAGTSVGKQANT